MTPSVVTPPVVTPPVVTPPVVKDPTCDFNSSIRGDLRLQRSVPPGVEEFVQVEVVDHAVAIQVG